MTHSSAFYSDKQYIIVRIFRLMRSFMSYAILLVSLFIVAPLFGQQKKNLRYKADSYDSIDPSIIQAEIDSAKSLFEENTIAAFELVESAIAKAVDNNARRELAAGYATLGSFNMALSEYNSAILHIGRALPIYSSLSDWNKVYENRMLLGECNSALGEYNLACNHYQKAHELAEIGNKLNPSLKSQIEMAGVQIKQEKYTDAETLLLSLRKEATAKNMNVIVGEIDYRLGEISELRGDAAQATDYYMDAQSNAIQTQDNDLVNRSNFRMVQTFSNSSVDLENKKDAFYNSLNTSAGYFQDQQDTIALIETSIQKADYLTISGDVGQAIEELNRSVELSRQLGDIENELSSQKKLYDAYASSNKPEEAVQAYSNYQNLLDSANKLRTNQKDELLQKQLALKTVEKEIDVLERERQLDQETILLLEKEQEVNNSALQQQRILLYVLGFIITIFIFIAILVYRNTKAKNRANQLLHLKNLRAQMNPHFIFNSLNSVNNYIAKSNERAANKYLAKFSRLMRMVLDYSQVEFISLTNEVELLRLYVELEHERFKDKFHYVFEVDETINTEQFQIPPMIVQPFIENAVWHGLRYKKEEGQLSVYFRDRGDHVEIEVSDDGIGRTKSQEIKTVNQKKHKSSGMRNIENRTEMIRSLFRKKIDYEISDLSEGKGTRVIIKLFDHE